jgi:hypothetical protein
MARKISNGLPTTLSIAQLVYLLDVTANRISQLVTDQIIQRPSTGKYAISSVPHYIGFLRQSGSGPAALSTARVNLASEKAALAKLTRLEREGAMVPVIQVREVYARSFGAIKARALSMPAKIASKLAICETAAEAEQLIKKEVLEFLNDAESGQVRFNSHNGSKHNGTRRRWRSSAAVAVDADAEEAAAAME